MARRLKSRSGALLLLVVTGLALVGVKAARTAHEMLHPPRIAVAGSVRDWTPDALEVDLQTRDGLTLSGWYAPSENGAAVILAHGHGGNRLQLLDEARMLQSRGFGVLLFDWRAHGNSGGNLSTRGDREPLDLIAAVDFLASRPDVEPGRIGVLGFSRGGNVALQTAAADTRIQAVVAAAAAPNMQEGVRTDLGRWAPVLLWPTLMAMRVYGVRPESLNPVGRICSIAPRPVLLISGSDDPTAPREFGDSLFLATCGNADRWTVKGAGHGAYALHAGPTYELRLVRFFRDALLSRPGRVGATAASGRRR